MPIAAQLRKYYGHHWRTVTRPRILERANGKCERCEGYAVYPEVAHLVIQPPDAGHDDEENLAALCIFCHKRFDYAEWARKCYETRCRRKDAARPLLGGTAR